MTSHDEQKWYQSKKAIALFVSLGVVLIIAVLGIIFHQAVSDLIGKIVALCTSYHVSQGAVDAMHKWKVAPSQIEQGFEKAKEEISGWAESGLNELDRYANR